MIHETYYSLTRRLFSQLNKYYQRKFIYDTISAAAEYLASDRYRLEKVIYKKEQHDGNNRHDGDDDGPRSWSRRLIETELNANHILHIMQTLNPSPITLVSANNIELELFTHFVKNDHCRFLYATPLYTFTEINLFDGIIEDACRNFKILPATVSIMNKCFQTIDMGGGVVVATQSDEPLRPDRDLLVFFSDRPNITSPFRPSSYRQQQSENNCPLAQIYILSTKRLPDAGGFYEVVLDYLNDSPLTILADTQPYTLIQTPLVSTKPLAVKQYPSPVDKFQITHLLKEFSTAPTAYLLQDTPRSNDRYFSQKEFEFWFNQHRIPDTFLWHKIITTTTTTDNTFNGAVTIVVTLEEGRRVCVYESVVNICGQARLDANVKFPGRCYYLFNGTDTMYDCIFENVYGNIYYLHLLSTTIITTGASIFPCNRYPDIEAFGMARQKTIDRHVFETLLQRYGPVTFKDTVTTIHHHRRHRTHGPSIVQPAGTNKIIVLYTNHSVDIVLIQCHHISFVVFINSVSTSGSIEFNMSELVLNYLFGIEDPTAFPYPDVLVNLQSLVRLI